MKLNECLKDIAIEKKFLFKDCEVIGISYLSEEIDKANVFVCIKGEKFDTHNIMENLTNKIDVFIVERINPLITKTQILVKNTRKILLKLLLNFNFLQKIKIKIIGVTGTNGKTTTTYYTKYLLEKLGFKVCVLGTSGCFIGNKKIETNLTTPTQKELVNLIKLMISCHVDFLVMEISAHAISQFRVEGLPFEVGCFTNLTHDHLDDFPSIYDYAFSKFNFISNCKIKIINIDDKFGKEFSLNNNVFSISKYENKANFWYNIKGQNLTILLEGNEYQFQTNINASYNYQNLVSALSICHNLGFSLNDLGKYCLTIPEVEGRYNLLKFGNKKVCIDYAHSPDALEKVLSNLKENSKDLIVVFGASGFRDSLKRVLMGKVVSKYCSFAILTADNPRYESIKQINKDLSEKITIPYVSIPNRKEAIKYAFEISRDDSMIAILGKGNETNQDICGIDIKYSDYLTCKELSSGENGVIIK